MPVIAVNIIKVVFAGVLYSFLLVVARAMRGHVAGPPIDPNPTPAPPSRRRGRSEDAPPPAPVRTAIEISHADGSSRLIPVRGRIVLGRGAVADITIDDEYSSDSHAAFESDGTALWVEDLGSTNGTRIGGVRITERTRVDPGTEILVGRTRVTVR
jgi:pSer/pThr/pTyr-binding forkhead associated (FHA) protein